MIMPFWQRHKVPSYLRAMQWCREHAVPDQGIIVHTKQPQPYPEVTGYYIPTLYQWNELALARSWTRWLLSIQLPSGAFPAPDGMPYTFDTGQVMRGLIAALDDVSGTEVALRRACDWVVAQVNEDGRLTTPTTELWTDIASDLIHTYVLPPLAEAGRKLGVKAYEDTARFVLGYYKRQHDLVPFNRLSHFHAYAMEALVELGEWELAKQGMAEAARHQTRNGRVPAYPNVGWVCSTGLAQYAVIWYNLGDKRRADSAIRYLEQIQNPSGGFYGSYGPGANYIPKAEISWAVKYFLDAYHLKLQGKTRHA